MLDNIVLGLYIFVWILTYKTYIKKHSSKNVGTFFILENLVFSICSLILFNDPATKGIWESISLFPFIYLYTMLMVAACPILCYDGVSVDVIRKPNQLVFNIFLWILIVSSILQIPNIISDLKEGLFLIFTDIDNAAEIYAERKELIMLETRSKADFSIISPLSIIANIFSDFCLFFFFYYQTLEKRKALVQLLLLIIIFFSIIRPISHADRTEAVLYLLTIAPTYLLFVDYVDQRRRKIMNIVIAIVAAIMIIPIAVITISRFTEKEGGVSTSIVSYMGQENLYFNTQVLNANGTREGERTSNVFKQMIGYDNVATDVRSVRAKYPNVGIDDTFFTTFVGDFVIDFGPVIPVALFIVFSFIFTVLTRPQDRRIAFHQLILIYFTMLVCVKGSMYLFVFSFTNNYKIMAFIFAYLLFRLTDSFNNGSIEKKISNGC